MTNANFYINIPICPTFPINPATVAQGSAVYVIVPETAIPDGVDNLSVVIKAPGSSEFVRVPLDPVAHGAWVEPYVYPAVGHGTYELVGMKDGHRIWFGMGDWNVIESGACGDPSPVVPPSGGIGIGYIPVYFAPDGSRRYRYGTVVVEEETGEPVTQWSREIYRFNFATGEYEEVAE